MRRRNLLLSLFSIACVFGLPPFAHSGIENSEIESKEAKKSSYKPRLFAIYQQQGPTCSYIAFTNLELIKSIRLRENGELNFQNSDWKTKRQYYALFAPKICSLDNVYNILMKKNGEYCAYEKEIRKDGIYAGKRYLKSGKNIEKIEPFYNFIKKSARLEYTPYNIDENIRSFRWLPIYKDEKGSLFFYDGEKDKSTQIAQTDLSQDMDLSKCIPVENDDKKIYFLSNDLILKIVGERTNFNTTFSCKKPWHTFGFPSAYYSDVSEDSLYSEKNIGEFYNLGTFQHILFACGLNSQNIDFSEKDHEYKAYKEYNDEMKKSKLSPWKSINKDDIFEYHLANIFKNNKDLKKRAIEAVESYVSAWTYYKDVFDLYDSSNKTNKLSTKFLPGEDQVLAYIFSSQLRLVWAASISPEALCSVAEIEESQDNKKLTNIIPAFLKKLITNSFLSKLANFGKKNSILNVWIDIKKIFLNDVVSLQKQMDFVSFNGHGSVISFDQKLVEKQSHSHKKISEILGIEFLDSHYTDEIKPFYMKN